MKTETKYDIVIFGATGFTGDLTAKYLANRMKEEPFRLGIAGRDEIKLAALKKALVDINPGCS